MHDANKLRKGQSAIEAITILGFVILFSIPLLALLTSLNKEEAVILQTRSSVKLMTDTANSVYIQGKNSSQIISVAIPQKLKNITFENIGGGEIIFSLELESGQTDISSRSISEIHEDSNITGSAGFNPGIQKVKVEYEDDKIKFTAIQ